MVGPPRPRCRAPRVRCRRRPPRRIAFARGFDGEAERYVRGVVIVRHATARRRAMARYDRDERPGAAERLVDWPQRVAHDCGVGSQQKKPTAMKKLTAMKNLVWTWKQLLQLRTAAKTKMVAWKWKLMP